MLSSVTGDAVSGSSLIDPAYWVRNMVSPVRFSQAVGTMCAAAPATIAKKLDMSHLLVPVVDHLLEVGPHAALQAPLRDILAGLPERTKRPAIAYSSALKRDAGLQTRCYAPSAPSSARVCPST
jgi:acyl transferase domain-containing protein